MRQPLFGRYRIHLDPLMVPIMVVTAAILVYGQIDPAPKKKRAMEDKKMTSLTREEITRRAARFGNPILTALQRPETNVEQIPTTFFTSGGIYRVSTRPPDRPRVYALGFWGTDGLEVLNNEPEHFFELASKSGLNLRSSGEYVAYVSAFFDVTRDFTGGIQILNSIQESWWLPSPSPEETRKKGEIIDKYTNVVEGPKLKDGFPATVILFVIRDRALLRMNAEVESNGRIRLNEEILEPEMPTVMLQ
ncbi:MAG: hypothetical protein K1X36_00170 [Pyrinomonadaceae bacterium]|nr:hypothetical protein [Pyrinomonadaceae bacterium]